jgi:hypothetical protein
MIFPATLRAAMKNLHANFRAEPLRCALRADRALMPRAQDAFGFFMT